MMTTHTSFHVFEADGTKRQEWLALLDSWSGWEVFAHPNYLSLYAEAGHRPICAVYRCPEGRVVYPLMLRDLRRTGFWGPDGEELFDTVSPPYGYGGPFVEGRGDKPSLIAKFFREYEKWALSRNVVSEYVTLSPKEENELPYPGKVIIRAPSVVRTLTISPDEIWRDYKGSVRTDVRTAQRAGVVIDVHLGDERVKEFLEIYTETMVRRNAPVSYHLSLAFLECLNRTLKGHYVYFYALLDGKVISTELLLVSADSTFFFRGGTRADAFHLRPNHLLKHHIILWSQRRGKRFYLLGGGNSAEDPLYRYKLSFAPRGARPLKVGKWILNPKRYKELVAARRVYEKARGVDWVPSPNYFPEYRAPSRR